MLVFAGCGGGSSSPDSGPGDSFVDAAYLDADIYCLSTCNPVAQTGCQQSEKCTDLHDQDGTSFCGPFCVPDGDVETGGACTIGPPGLESYDDCVAGNLCVAGTCGRVCTRAPDSCDDGFACTPLDGYFEGTQNVGTCASTCDPLAQDCAQDPSDPHGTGCYLEPLTGYATCAAATPEPPASMPGTQGETCMTANGCALGYGCLLLDAPVNPVGNVCAFLCDADAGGGPTCADGPGDTYTCVAINGFYDDTTNVAANIGMCVDCTVWTDAPGCQ
jgi:hypothetical protein